MTTVIADVSALAERLAADVEIECQRVQASGRHFTLAIPGGSVATACFPRLAALAIDWTRCEFFWVDERAVAGGDPESNYGLARALWLDPARVPEARVHRMPGDDPDLAVAAARYADVIAGIAGRPPRLDYVILGVGPDGHVASLFPGRPLVTTVDDLRIAAAVVDSPKPPPRRLTLTLPVLTGAARLVVVAFGSSKAAVIGEALGDPASKLPVALALRGAARPLVLLDPDAGRLVPRGGAAGASAS